MENREALLVMHQMKVPVASADGTRLEVRTFQPGEFLKRSDWDRFPARSKRSMTNTGFVRDPLNVKIDPRTGQPESLPTPRPGRTVLRKAGPPVELVNRATGEVQKFADPGGLDRRLQSGKSEKTASKANAAPSQVPQSGLAAPPAKVVLRQSKGWITVIDPRTGQETQIMDPGGLDRREQLKREQQANADPPKRKRGRPRKVRV